MDGILNVNENDNYVLSDAAIISCDYKYAVKNNCRPVTLCCNDEIINTEILQNVTNCVCYTQEHIDNIIRYSKKLSELCIDQCENFIIPNDIILNNLTIRDCNGEIPKKVNKLEFVSTAMYKKLDLSYVTELTLLYCKVQDKIITIPENIKKLKIYDNDINNVYYIPCHLDYLELFNATVNSPPDYIDICLTDNIRIIENTKINMIIFRYIDEYIYSNNVNSITFNNIDSKFSYKFIEMKFDIPLVKLPNKLHILKLKCTPEDKIVKFDIDKIDILVVNVGTEVPEYIKIKSDLIIYKNYN